MTASKDQLGDVLRRFYGSYGVPNEGPPADLNVSALFPVPTTVAPKTKILNNALNDAKLLSQFRNCRDLLDDLATRLTGEDLLRELVGTPSQPRARLRSCPAVSSGFRSPVRSTRAKGPFRRHLSTT
jgi:hypothetical protein